MSLTYDISNFHVNSMAAVLATRSLVRTELSRGVLSRSWTLKEHELDIHSIFITFPIRGEF